MMLLFALAAALTLSYACGDDGEDQGEPAATFPAGGGGDDEAEVQRFDISLVDNAFEPAEFTARGGVIAAFSITSSGAAIHNVRMAGADDEFANEDDAVSEPTLVNGGETATLEWPTPSAGGTFAFRCDFHPQAMVGTITVEPAGDLPDGGTEGP
jgi:plastocyanin